jgi:hypothetical protein
MTIMKKNKKNLRKAVDKSLQLEREQRSLVTQTWKAAEMLDLSGRSRANRENILSRSSSFQQTNETVLRPDVDEYIVKAGALSDNLCLFTAILNGLRTEKKRYVWSGKNSDEPAKLFIESNRERVGISKRQPSYSSDDVSFYLRKLMMLGLIEKYVYQKLRYVSFHKLLLGQKKSETYILHGHAPSPEMRERYKNRLGAFRDANADKGWSEQRMEAEVITYAIEQAPAYIRDKRGDIHAIALEIAEDGSRYIHCNGLLKVE